MRINPDSIDDVVKTTVREGTVGGGAKLVDVGDTDGNVVSKIYAGWGHSAIVYEDGTVKTCGRNVCGQLGTGELSTGKCRINERGHHYSPNFTKVEGLDNRRILSCALGGEHTLFVADDGTILGVGSNRSGQLGEVAAQEEESVFSPLVLSWMKKSRRKVLQISCGNEVSLFLTTNPIVPSLFQLVAETIKRDSELLEALRRDCMSSVVTETTPCTKADDNILLEVVADIISDVIARVENFQEEPKDENKWLLDYVLKQI